MELDELFAAHDWDVVYRLSGWRIERDRDDAAIVRASLRARDGEEYHLQLLCDDYPERPPSVTFVNEEGWASDVRAWPSGTPAFHVFVKPPPVSFLCLPLTREGLSYHRAWTRDPSVDAWDPRRHHLLDVLARVQLLLDGPEYLGRGAAPLRREIVLSTALLNETWRGLRRRGDGRRESMCVWPGRRVPRRQIVTGVIFLDDLPGTSATETSYTVSPEASGALFRQLDAMGCDIVAALHTHPGDAVDLSPADRASPLEYRVGFLSIVIPGFADGAPALDRIGVHEYVGDGEWRTLAAAEIAARLIVEDGVAS